MTPEAKVRVSIRRRSNRDTPGGKNGVPAPRTTGCTTQPILVDEVALDELRRERRSTHLDLAVELHERRKVIGRSRRTRLNRAAPKRGAQLDSGTL